MKRAIPTVVALLIVGLFVVMLAGCGGSNDGTSASAPGVGTAKIAINWPVRSDDAGADSAAIPATAESIKVTFSDETGVIKDGIIDRPDDTATFELPSKELTVRAKAHPFGTAAGNCLARAETAATIPVDDTLHINLELQSTIASVAVGPDPVHIDVGGQGQLLASARNADDALVMVAPDAFNWSVTSGAAHATVSNDGVIEGVSEGNAVVQATETGSGVSGTGDVMVTDPVGGGVGGSTGALSGKISFNYGSSTSWGALTINADGSGWPRAGGHGHDTTQGWHPNGRLYLSGMLYVRKVSEMDWWCCEDHWENSAPPCIDPDRTSERVAADHDFELRDDDFAWSPQGAHIIFVDREFGEPGDMLWVIDYNAADPPSSNCRVLVDLVQDQREIRYPVWSPDGTMVAFCSYDANDNVQIFVTDMAGSVQQLTSASYPDLLPTWSPDGSMIAFYRGSAPVSEKGIYAINRDGTGLNQLRSEEDEGQRMVLPRWSADGRTIAYQSGNSYSGYDICAMNADGTGRRVLVERDEWYNSWAMSPTGGHVAYDTLTDVGGERAAQVWVVSVDGSSRQKVFDVSDYVDSSHWESIDNIQWTQF